MNVSLQIAHGDIHSSLLNIICVFIGSFLLKDKAENYKKAKIKGM